MTRGPQAGSVPEENPPEPGRVWTFHQTPGIRTRVPTEQKQGGTETKQIAPLKPPEIHVPGMFAFWPLFPAAGYLKNTNLSKLQLQSIEPSVCLLLVFASGTNILYTLVWIVSEADRNAWPRRAKTKSLLTVQNEPGTIGLSSLPEASTPGHPEARRLG